jgi:CheY-like chemotaxis protein/GAF domain-containing protein/PAS domain-containing protein
VSDRPRLLLLAPSTRPDWPDRLAAPAEVVRASTWTAGLEALRKHAFDALVADLGDPAFVDTLKTLHQANHILAHVADGIAVVDFDLRIRWANPTFQRWSGGNPVGRGFYDALGSPWLGTDFCPFHSALVSRSPTPDGGPACVSCRLQCRDNRHIELHITPLFDGDSTSPASSNPLFIALGHDATDVVQQQQKLDALHRAGRELTALDRESLAEMTVGDRIEFLKGNIRRLTRDLLHYEVIEIRLLDESTGRLELLLQDGMAPEAAGRQLFASPENNGVTGFVAATGKSYLCPDTQNDSLYIPGALGAHSSLTVPLRFGDRIVGTFNVESPKVDAFGEQDLQFAEIFSHAVAAALHTLDLLSAEKSSGANQSIEAVNREVALPVDDILADATTLLERYVGHGPEVSQRIRKILSNARLIKESILKVGEEVAPRPMPTGFREPPPPALKGVRVLVADNDDRVRRSAHALIGRWGGIVETARDGHEALTMARLASYDAIVADIRLPDLSGYQAYRALREAQPHARVILMTGYGYDPGHSLVKARQDGLRHVLFKPFRVDQLRDALKDLEPGGNNAPVKPKPQGEEQG